MLTRIDLTPEQLRASASMLEEGTACETFRQAMNTIGLRPFFHGYKGMPAFTLLKMDQTVAITYLPIKGWDLSQTGVRDALSDITIGNPTSTFP
jgi:hypothetical protein